MNVEELTIPGCYRATNIENNDKVLIGGNLLSRELNLAVTADIENFERLFKNVETNAKRFEDNNDWNKWLHDNYPTAEPKLFFHLLAFDNVLRKMYPNMSANESQRTGFYDNKGSKKLSQSFSYGVCMCAEIALLAQAYLQRAGFDTTFFNGELLHSAEDEFGEAHSFLSIKTDKGDYFYDPANPVNTNIGFMPRLSAIEATPAQKKQFENTIHSTNKGRHCAFLEAKDIFSKSSWYYGCGDGCNICPEFIISKNRTQAPHSSERDL